MRSVVRFLGLSFLVVALALAVVSCEKKQPGVTKTEIKIGHINPYSGPASAYGAIGRNIAA